MKKAFFLFPLALLAAFVFFVGPGCANIVPPQGGPRDSLPPRLVKATPASGSVNVQPRTIELTFDEFIDFNTGAGTIVVSPMYNVKPEVTARLRTLTIKLKDSLEANTTYSFAFENNIKDINEGNVLQNFTYVFATGPALDSLTLSGSVQLAETGRLDSSLTVMLYRNMDDSAVAKENPRYITGVNSAGRFTFNNLPRGTFKVYVLDDKSRTRRYMTKTQLFGFADSAVTVAPGTTPEVQLFAYAEQGAAAASATATRPAPQPATDRRLKYTPPAGSAQDLQSDFKITFDNRITKLDSSKVQLSTDTTFKPAPATLSLDSTGRVLTLKSSWQPGALYNLVLGKDFATDSTGRSQLRNDTLSFRTRKTTEYGTLNLRFRNITAGPNPVLQLVQNNAVVFSAPVTAAGIVRPLFAPGEYELRILFDANGNGKWDPGAFFKGRKQPEIVVGIERRLTIKADQDVEVEVAVPDIPGRK